MKAKLTTVLGKVTQRYWRPLSDHAPLKMISPKNRTFLDSTVFRHRMQLSFHRTERVSSSAFKICQRSSTTRSTTTRSPLKGVSDSSKTLATRLQNSSASAATLVSNTRDPSTATAPSSKPTKSMDTTGCRVFHARTKT